MCRGPPTWRDGSAFLLASECDFPRTTTGSRTTQLFHISVPRGCLSSAPPFLLHPCCSRARARHSDLLIADERVPGGDALFAPEFFWTGLSPVLYDMAFLLLSVSPSFSFISFNRQLLRSCPSPAVSSLERATILVALILSYGVRQSSPICAELFPVRLPAHCFLFSLRMLIQVSVLPDNAVFRCGLCGWLLISPLSTHIANGLGPDCPPPTASSVSRFRVFFFPYRVGAAVAVSL